MRIREILCGAVLFAGVAVYGDKAENTDFSQNVKVVKLEALGKTCFDSNDTTGVEKKLSLFQVDELKFKNAPLTQAVVKLRELARKADPEHNGIKFVLAFPPEDKKPRIPELNIEAENVSLEKALRDICENSGMKYKIEKDVVVIYEFSQSIFPRESHKFLKAVCIDNKWGIADGNGNLIVEAKFDSIYGIADGIVGVEVGKKDACIDMTGEFVTEP